MEPAMKLNSVLVERAVSQIGADPIPDQHPAMPQLNQVFGEHTFFVDNNGLHIVVASETEESGELTGEVMQVARWSDGNHTTLAPQQPEPTGVVIVLATGGSDEPA
jgi:hypothetical protein